MKVRRGFVSNSSSSSFVVIRAGDTFISGDEGSEEYEWDTMDSYDVPIQELIDKLLAAQAAGATTVNITHGGGYDG